MVNISLYRSLVAPTTSLTVDHSLVFAAQLLLLHGFEVLNLHAPLLLFLCALNLREKKEKKSKLRCEIDM